jgi:2-hydroxychromene-2-carboxylate isomerase
MAVSVYSYTIYHSPNAYLGTPLLRRAVAELPGVELVRRPIYVPREHGLMTAAGTARCRAPARCP